MMPSFSQGVRRDQRRGCPARNSLLGAVDTKLLARGAARSAAARVPCSVRSMPSFSAVIHWSVQRYNGTSRHVNSEKSSWNPVALLGTITRMTHTCVCTRSAFCWLLQNPRLLPSALRARGNLILGEYLLKTLFLGIRRKVCGDCAPSALC